MGTPQLFIFKLCLNTVMKWILRIGWLRHREAEPAGPWPPPQPHLAESLSEAKLRASPHRITCAIFRTNVIAALPTVALQLEQRGVGIWCAEAPASALTTSSVSFLHQVAIDRGIQGEASTGRASSTYHTPTVRTALQKSKRPWP